MTTIDPLEVPQGYADYVRVGEFLAPAHMAAEFGARAHDPRSGDVLAWLEGQVSIRAGVASVVQLTVTADPTVPDSTPITTSLLGRLNMLDLAFQLVARCSLTRWQSAHYRLEPLPAVVEDLGELVGLLEGFWSRERESREYGTPLPVREPPAPALVDPDGTPWYPVQVVSDAARSLSRLPRPSVVTPEFLRAALSVYRMAQRSGVPTTAAVADWYFERTGRDPSRRTVLRWISKAKQLHEEGDDDAQDK